MRDPSLNPYLRSDGCLPAAPADSRVYAIGDIHGRLDLLRRLHELIAADASEHPARRRVVVYLGDYIDRGADSCGVIDLLLSAPLAGFECYHLKGNHEDIALRFLGDAMLGPNWLRNGAAETMESYGVSRPTPLEDPAEILRAQRQLGERMPPEHLAFFGRLALSHAEGDYFFAHAGVRPEVPLMQQHARDLMWIREEFLLSDTDFGKVVVHGHTIDVVPRIKPNRIGIDTGAYRSGRLTALVLDGMSRTFLQTSAPG
jgi:serine/threonine protein phosphatase 1